MRSDFLNKRLWQAAGGIALSGVAFLFAGGWLHRGKSAQTGHSVWGINFAPEGDAAPPPSSTEANSPYPWLSYGCSALPPVEAAANSAKRDPQRELKSALSESDLSRRDKRVAEALRDWAQTDPEGAADWLKRHPDSASESTWGALFDGAIVQPERAIGLARQLSRADPDRAREYGYGLIFAFHRASAFEQAATYAAGDPGRWQPDLMIAAYHDWGRQFPEAAFVSAIRLPDGSTRSLAIQSILSGWSREDPEGMAETALRFPEGRVKESALIKAIRAWLIKDPEKARDWILSHDRAIPAAEIALQQD